MVRRARCARSAQAVALANRPTSVASERLQSRALIPKECGRQNNTRAMLKFRSARLPVSLHRCICTHPQHSLSSHIPVRSPPNLARLRSCLVIDEKSIIFSYRHKSSDSDLRSSSGEEAICPSKRSWCVFPAVRTPTSTSNRHKSSSLEPGTPGGNSILSTYGDDSCVRPEDLA